MKTSYSRAWGMQAFHTCIYDISTYIEYGNNITEINIIYPILSITWSHPSASTSPTSAPSHESMGNGEV